MKQFAFLLLSVFLVACDGYEYDNSDSDGGGSGDDLKFSSSELVDKIFFTDQIQSSNIQESFILRFESSSRLEQILLQTDTTALSGKYAWTIANNKIQVTYPSAVVCTTTKTKDNNSKFETTGSCTGGTGTPVNAIIKGDLIKPLSFTDSSLEGKEITIDLGNNQEEVLKFDDNGTSFTVTKKDNGQASNPDNGTYKQSVYTNVVRLEFPSDSLYRLLVLVKDNLSDGKILELRYGTSDNILKAIRVYSTSNNQWELKNKIETISKETT